MLNHEEKRDMIKHLPVDNELNQPNTNEEGASHVNQRIWILIIAAFGISCGEGGRQIPPPKQEAIVQKAQVQSSAALVAEVKEKLAVAKSKLAQEGKYDCCLREPCNHCALAESSCTCSQEVKHGEAVCDECYAGWQEGKGDVPNIKKENVKADFMEPAGKR